MFVAENEIKTEGDTHDGALLKDYVPLFSRELRSSRMLKVL